MPTPKAGYRAADGEKLPSVTTILSRFKDSTFLMRWVYKQGREHGELDLRGHLWRQFAGIREAKASISVAPIPKPVLDVIAKTSRLWDCPEPEPAPRDQYDKAGKAALAGTIAHDMVEQHILSGSKSEECQLPLSAAEAAPEIIEKAINAFRQYRAWAKTTRISVTHTELGLVSEKHRFGGTLDAVGKDAAGNIVLLDWKTSNGVYGDYLYQLAAYSLLLEENHPELTPRGFHLLRFAKESADFAHHAFGELDQEREAFLLMRRLYEIDQRTSKRA